MVSGAQGALLSSVLRPVYLTSLVLGSLLHPHHMYRAICGRIESYISSLPPPFRLHRPLLARAASTEARTPARAPSFSVCWCATTPLSR
ncbi:double-stranded RNA-specific editase Adar-like [Amyelois transitella]|uniref:double-stranded RNA-specific editase Adar-like n=1 Tax=Amyelois transitella TaxID=680683 RepID=UPI00298F6772|nr:double-stranded RNA-specific editase Adar-like [Amyelois transitella]